MTSDIRTQIESANSQFMGAFKRGDTTAMANLYTSEAQLLPANTDFVRGTAAIRAFWQGVMDMGLKDASLETVEVEPHGDTAIEVGRYRLLAAGGVVADNGKYVVVWKTTVARGSSIVTSGRQASRLPHRCESPIQWEPARPLSRAIVSPRRAAQLEALGARRSN